MKTLLTLLFVLTSFSSFSSTIFKATVEDTFCVEMDPFVVGDVCLLNLEREDNGKKLTLLLDFDEFSNQDGELEGQVLSVDSSKLEKIRNREVLSILLDYDNNYYYMNASIDAFEVVENPSTYEMKKFISKLSGYFYVGNLPAGYSAKNIETPELKANFKAYLKGVASGKLNDWEELVYESGEYDNLSRSEKEKVAKNPWKEMGVKYLLEVTEVHQILRKGRVIGYYVEVSDHVQAAIYQDGAWIEMLLDLDMNVLKATDESA
ncbi:MAG: hypothetical protein KC493_11030 [Bacteriovoracaceae bacterium]|nr:hypothetical protein [Bacteriovoracaceae bacterium]